MRTRIRVAAILDTRDLSGPGRQLVAVASALHTHGVEVRAFCFHRSGRESPALAAAFHEAGLSTSVMPDRGPMDVRLPGLLSRRLREWQPDIIQTHGYRASVLLGLLRRRLRSIPWIAFRHGETRETIRMRLYQALERKVIRRADRIVMMSDRMTTDFGSGHPGIRRLYNAVIPRPPGALPPGLTGQFEALPRPLLGVFARLSPEKGVDVFLRALSRTRCSAVIAGDGPCREELQRLSDHLGLARRVLFTGHLAAVDALYREVDMVVLPSRSEGLPNVLLEALHNDRPIVATDVGGVREVVGDTMAAVVVQPEAPALLADGIMRALDEGRERQAREARAAVARRFSLETRVRAHMNLYREILPQGTLADSASPHSLLPVGGTP